MLSTSQTRSTVESQAQIVIADTYVIAKNIYKGKLYNLYLAIKKQVYDGIHQDEERFCLIKMKRQQQQTETIPELFFLQKLKDCKLLLFDIFIANCIPHLLAYGEQIIKGINYHYQVMQRHGPSIKLIYNYMSENIPISLLCLFAIQTLTCLETIHKHQIVHRNIRPKKLLLSMNNNEILLSDFKYACRFKKQHGMIIVNENYKLVSNKSFLNKYSSVSQHLNQIPTPKDDLESLAYILLLFSTNLNIFKIQADNPSLKLKKLENLKISLIPEITFKSAPQEFIHFLNLIKTSDANDYPQDYEKYKSIFKKIITNNGQSEKDITYPNFGNYSQSSLNMQSQLHTQTTSRFKKTQHQKMSTSSIKEEEIDDESPISYTDKVGEDKTIEPLMKGLPNQIYKHITILNHKYSQKPTIIKLKDMKKK